MAKTKSKAAKGKLTLSPKVAKADKLRLEAVKALQKMKKITPKWIAEAEAEKDVKKRKEIDKKYDKLFEQADTSAAAAYRKYYDYVEDNFSKEDTAVAMRKGLKTGSGFMGKTFISTLNKQQKAANNKRGR